jgi:hypothetical protein
VTDNVLSACSIDGVAGTVLAGTCRNNEIVAAPGGTASCVYDYSAAGKYDLPNCCQGITSISTTTVNTTVTPNTSSTNTSPVDFNGRFRNCMYSAHDYAKDWPLSDDKKAADLITALQGSSLLRTQKIPGTFEIFNKKQRPNSYANVLNAGFHDWAAYVANPGTWLTTHVTPISIKPTADFSGSPPPSAVGDGSERIRCLGSAGEVRHEIRVYLNEWNTMEDYLAFKQGADPSTVTPTRTGVAGVDCAAVNQGISCNTRWGFDDLTAAFGPTVFPNEFGLSTPQ